MRTLVGLGGICIVIVSAAACATGASVARESAPLVECVDSRPEVGQTDRVFPYLEALGYRGYFFPHGRTESLTRFRVERHQVAPDAEWLVNFGFLPKERV